MNLAIICASKCYFQQYRALLKIHNKLLKYIPILLQHKYRSIIVMDDDIGSNPVDKTETLHSNNRFITSSLINNLFDQSNTNNNNQDMAEISNMLPEQLEVMLLESVKNNEHGEVEKLIKSIEASKKHINKKILLKLFQTYSLNGKPNIILLLQSYCSNIYPMMYQRNGKYLHFLARAWCMKGNSKQGLSLLKECYNNNEQLRTMYRTVFKDLINDSVLNRSEASLVIFKKYVLEFSEIWQEHYPLLCFWHICWVSEWFSDQMLANELLELSVPLRNIIKERAPALCINILRIEYNEDAVTRMLQCLLQHEMLVEYAKVLQVLFGHKLRNRDIRGCREIIHNCEVLGLPISSEQRGKYVMLLVNHDYEKPAPTKPFKLKF